MRLMLLVSTSCSVLDGTAIPGSGFSFRMCPSPNAMICTYLCWVARPTYPPHDLPKQVTEGVARASHASDALVQSAMLTLAVGDEYHTVFECPAVETGFSTCSPDLPKQCGSSCGKWTCALLICVSEIACLCF